MTTKTTTAAPGEPGDNEPNNGPTFSSTTWKGNAALVVGPYRLFEVLGSGGVGLVYRAVHSTTSREVALKILSPTIAADSTWRARFIREARQLARLRHPNVVGCTDLDERDGTLYMALELMRGGDSESLVRRSGGKLAEATAAAIVRDAARGLAAAHGAHLIHRDIKPSNLMLTDDGRAKIGDFGLVQVLDNLRPLTIGDKVVGTPSFMSPEQVDGSEELDLRSDLFSLGATFYYLLTGRPPFIGASPWAVLNQVLASSLPDPRRKVPELSEDVAAIVLKAGAHQRDERYANAGQLADDLDLLLAGRRPVHAPPVPVGGTPRINRPQERMPRVMVARPPSAGDDPLCERLRSERFIVEIIPDPRHLPAALTGDPPDLLVLDLSDPERLGVDTLRVIRRRPELNALPVLVLTTGGEEAVEAAWRAGAMQVLIADHMDPGDFLREVRRTIGMDVGNLPTMPVTRRFSALDTRRQPLVERIITVCSQVRGQVEILPQGSPAAMAQAVNEIAGLLRAAESAAKELDGGAYTLLQATLALLRELAEMPHHASAAVLRTVARGLDSAAKAATSDTQRLVARTALVVDDDAVSRLMMVNALRVVGIAADIAVDATGALAAAGRKRYDLVLSDVMMEGLNGFQFIAKLRQLPNWDGVPVVFVTSLADFDQFFRTVPGGACDLIAKPFLLTELGLKALIHLADGPGPAAAG